MLGHERRSKVLAKLINARCELDDALNLAIPVARYDPVVIPEPARHKLSVCLMKFVPCYDRSKVRNDWRQCGLLVAEKVESLRLGGLSASAGQLRTICPMTRTALVRVAGACIVLDLHLAEQARDPERALDAVCRLVSHGDLFSDVWSGRDAPLPRRGWSAAFLRSIRLSPSSAIQP